MAIDPKKAANAADLLSRPAAISALKAITGPEVNYDWARSLGLQALSEIAATAAPVPTPPVEPPIEPPVVVPPVEPPATAITTQAAFDQALTKGGNITLGKGSFTLNVKGSGITITATPETIFKTGGSISGRNITLKGGKVLGKAKMANGVPLLKIEGSDGLTLDGVEFAGSDNSGVAIFGRNVKNLTVIRCDIHNVRDGVMIWTGFNIVVEDNIFSQMGSDCFDPSGVDGVYFRRNKIRDARHMASAHPDIVQLGTAPCKNVYIEDNDSEADTMGYDDFGCTGPNLNVNVRRNKIRTVGYENTIRFLVPKTTGEVVDNVIIKGGSKNPLFSVPSSMKKSGNTIDGKPI